MDGRIARKRRKFSPRHHSSLPAVTPGPTLYKEKSIFRSGRKGSAKEKVGGMPEDPL
jgi:hypothetical protein